jgi:plastocyanin
VSAQSLAFDTNKITVPPGVSVRIIFNNKESIPHNVAIYTDSSAQTVIFRGDVITGPKTITYEFVAPAAPGTYFFRCDIHPSAMNGSFVVAP